MATHAFMARPAAALLALLGATAQPGAASAAEPATAATSPAIALIDVHGDAGQAQRFDAAALGKLPQHTVQAQAHGKSVTCTGPNLIDVLGTVGAPSGETLRGKNLALYVRVSAADGYRAVFALAELDPGMRDAVPILTAQCDGAALDEKEGPFRIVVPGEKRPARWVRQVTTIDVLGAP
jgi:hypothetical protein